MNAQEEAMRHLIDNGSVTVDAPCSYCQGNPHINYFCITCDGTGVIHSTVSLGWLAHMLQEVTRTAEAEAETVITDLQGIPVKATGHQPRRNNLGPNPFADDPINDESEVVA